MRREYYLKNRLTILKKRKEYAKENKQAIALYQKEYSDKNRDSLQDYFKDYRNKNKERLQSLGKEYYYKNKSTFCKKKKIYRSTKNGKIITVLNNINKRCYDSNNSSYKYYGLIGIKNFLTYEHLSDLWDRDNASNMKKPSIDRRDKNKNYEISNCQFIEHSENIAKDKRKEVCQIIGNKVVGIFESITKASIESGVCIATISYCCNGKYTSKRAMTWRFKDVFQE